MNDPVDATLSPAQGRLCIVAAAVLWSTGGAFVNLLTQPTALGLNEPRLEPLPIAFYRGLFAGLVLSLTLRRQDVSFRPLMLVMVLCFALMNVTFIAAMALGKSANSILLQYTAPMWMYLASVWLLREPADRRGTVALAVGMLGIAVIIAGGWEAEHLLPIALALASGVTYAGVLICLRLLRNESLRWLTVLNHLCSALVLLPWVWSFSTPTLVQMGVLACFGVFQMASAYWLVAHGLRVVSPQEAGTLTLLEPLLNPLWAYFVSPAKEELQATTFIGGALILGGLHGATGREPLHLIQAAPSSLAGSREPIKPLCCSPLASFMLEDTEHSGSAPRPIFGRPTRNLSGDRHESTKNPVGVPSLGIRFRLAQHGARRGPQTAGQSGHRQGRGLPEKNPAGRR